MEYKHLNGNGLKIGAAIEGEGPLIVLVHGWPESWYSWRHQIPFLSSLGYKVAAIDVRGYGQSDKPYEIAEYSMKNLTSDVISVIEDLGYSDAILFGHDWGAPIVWNTAALYPDKISAVGALSVPYTGRGPMSSIDLWKMLYKGKFFYQLYFQEEGVAEEEFEKDLKEKIEFKSKRELLVYSYRVAGTVGLMMAKILRVKSKTALKSAIDLGIAMQLTNISRDVIEDREKNREYIKHDLSNIKNTITTADLFYNSCFNSIREIPIRCRFAILVARRVYREIGYKIIKKRDIEEYNQSGKIYVTKSGKIVQTILSIFDFFRLLFIQSDNYYRNEEHNEIGLEINIDERI